MTTKKALVAGVTGQDGSYLAELLLEKGYEVHGIIRRSSSFNTGRIDHIFDQLHLHYGDLTDMASLVSVLHEVKPDEVYNLGAQSHVKVSFANPIYTAQATALGALNLLEAFRIACPEARFYQASSSEMFGSAFSQVNSIKVQNESTPFHPRSPYAVSKVFAHQAAVNYRESYGLFISCGILFNHESPRRNPTFVTRKITRAVARIIVGLEQKLVLGNLDACRDWGFAPDYVRAMYLMLQQPRPDDYVIATGVTHSVREFADRAFGAVGLDYRKYVETDPKYFRPAEVDYLCGDATKAWTQLFWKPLVSFDDLVKTMVHSDLESISPIANE
jgi:GDPmannose 4,6-dehydratase